MQVTRVCAGGVDKGVDCRGRWRRSVGVIFFLRAKGGRRDVEGSRGLGDVYKERDLSGFRGVQGGGEDAEESDESEQG